MAKLIVRPTTHPWMRSELENHQPGAVLARVSNGPGWWDLDDRLHALPGSIRVSKGYYTHWAVIPPKSLKELATLYAEEPARIKVYAA